MNKQKTLEKIKEILIKNNLTVSSAESCTGGLISSYLTDISGSSAYIFQNFVTYSNDAKAKYLDVKKQTLDKYGAVSEQTAFEMAKGLLKYASCSVATTGILGPTGFTKEKPIGLVYISFGYKDKIKVIKYISKKASTKDRYKIKKDITEKAITEFKHFLNETFKDLKND